MKLKKILLSIGSLATIVAPIATMVSCGEPSSSQFSEEDMLKMSSLKSSEASAKLQNLWLSKVLMTEYGITGKTQLQFLQNIDNLTDAFKSDFKNTLEWVLKDKLFASKDALSTIYQSVRTNAPEDIAGTDEKPGTKAVEALRHKVFSKSDIERSVNDIFTDDSWEDVFYNYSFSEEDSTKVDYNPSILGIKDLVLKMLITKKYLSITSTEFKDAMPAEYTKLADKFKVNDGESIIGVTQKNFPLIMSVINSRLAYKNSIELEENKSGQFIVNNTDNHFTSAKKAVEAFKRNGKFEDALTYSLKNETVVPSLLAVKDNNAKVDDDFIDIELLNGTIGFKGIDALPSGKEALDTSSADSLKLVTEEGARSGFVVDEKIVTKPEDIRFTDKDKTKVEISYYTSLLPIYDVNGKTLTFDNMNIDIDILQNVAYTKDETLYAEAIKYFTEKTEPILISVTNDWARNYYLDEGIKYIKTEDGESVATSDDDKTKTPTEEKPKA